MATADQIPQPPQLRISTPKVVDPEDPETGFTVTGAVQELEAIKQTLRHRPRRRGNSYLDEMEGFIQEDVRPVRFSGLALAGLGTYVLYSFWVLEDANNNYLLLGGFLNLFGCFLFLLSCCVRR